MSIVVGALNRLLTAFADLLFAPLRGLGAVWALLIVSFAAGAAMVWAFGRLSNQQAVGLVRERIRGNLLGMRIFGDDVRLLFTLLGRVLGWTAAYLRLFFFPLLVMLLPLLALVVQLDLRFSARPLAPGDRAVITVRASEGLPLELLELRAGDGLEVETAGVRASGDREVAWRIRAEGEGVHQLELATGADVLSKTVVVGEGWPKLSKRRVVEASWTALLHPGEPPIPRVQRIESIALDYAPRSLSLLGFDFDWLTLFFVASLVFGFAVHKPLGVRL